MTSGPDRVFGRAGIDTLRIDFSREDLPGSRGVTMNGQVPSPGNPYGTYSRLTPDASYTQDAVAFHEMERAEIVGTSKRDEIGPVNYNHPDVLEGRDGDDLLWGLGGSDILIGGEGNDALYGQHVVYNGDGGEPAADTDGHDIFDAGPGNDYVENFFTRWSVFPEPFLAAGTMLQLDGGPGFDTLSADFGNETDPVVWHHGAPTDLNFSSGAYARNFEDLRYFRSGSGNDFFTHAGRSNQWFITRDGNDVIRPGLGRDEVNGGNGDDFIPLDVHGLVVSERPVVRRGGGRGGSCGPGHRAGEPDHPRPRQFVAPAFLPPRLAGFAGTLSSPPSGPLPNPEPTRPNSGTKPPAQAGKPRELISERDARSSWNPPDALGHRLEAPRQIPPKTRCQNLLGNAVGKGMFGTMENLP